MSKNYVCNNLKCRNHDTTMIMHCARSISAEDDRPYALVCRAYMPLGCRVVEDEMTLEQRIESACECLPEGWRVRIDIEIDAADVTVIRPDGSEVPMSDGERDIEDQLTGAIFLALDETSVNTGDKAR